MKACVDTALGEAVRIDRNVAKSRPQLGRGGTNRSPPNTTRLTRIAGATVSLTTANMDRRRCQGSSLRSARSDPSVQIGDRNSRSAAEAPQSDHAATAPVFLPIEMSKLIEASPENAIVRSQRELWLFGRAE